MFLLDIFCCRLYFFFFFFFSSRRRHTRYIGDWSSDVCSSDLPACRREKTYGYHRAGTLAAFTNAFVLVFLSLWLGRSEERRVGKVYILVVGGSFKKKQLNKKLYMRLDLYIKVFTV